MRVLCNDEKCMWWKKCKPQKLVYGRGQEGLTEYNGECDRKEDGGEEITAILPKNVVSHDVLIHMPVCQGFSNIKISGHMNFSSMLQSDGTPYGGNIPDPIPGDSCYHT